MGCGQSNSVRRLNTTPLVRRDGKDNEGQDANQWHINNSKEEQKAQAEDWDFAQDLPSKPLK